MIEQGKGEVWEQNDGSMIVVWPVGSDLNETIQLAVRTVLVIRKRCKTAQYRLSVRNRSRRSPNFLETLVDLLTAGSLPVLFIWRDG